MKIDYKTVDARHFKQTGVELVKKISKLCDEKISKAPIWTKEAVPSTLLITPDQFKEFGRLQEEPSAEPTGKELFKTGGGYMLEIKVVEG
jgi:hypothetical protein